MEGDLAPLPALVDLVHRHGAFLLTDDAHAFGLVGPTGRGAAEHFGIDPESIDIRIGSLSKAIPAVGGFAAVDASIAILLRYISQGRVFSAAMTPPDAGAALAAIRILEREPERVRLLQRNAAVFRSALARRDLDTFESETAIVPVKVGDRMRTLSAASALLDRGVYVNPIIAPGVRPGSERLRCLVTIGHSEDDLEYAAAAISDAIDAKASAT
jgi:8-amino-7-oxononanoate synthase